MALSSAGGVAEQAALVEEAVGFVAEQRFHLRKAIEQHDLEMALRCGQRLANELRSTLLAPEDYYQLYILVYWELQYLAAFVAQTELHGLSLSEVYELVQYEGNVLPRLYLLVTVAAAYMQSSAVSTVDEILTDIMSLISAVQHPMRGLFLRYYVLQMTKDKLVHRLSVEAVLRFFLDNFHESATLWVRLRQQAASTATEQSHAKQAEPPTMGSSFFAAPPVVDKAWHLDPTTRSLRLLVGAHLINIARLPLMTVDLHLQVVLPEALKQSTMCQDPAGKAYLLDCFIQVFPDSYLVFTLDRVLAACAEVHHVVDLKPLLQRLMQRLTQYLKDSPGAAPAGVEVFTLFHDHLRDLHKRPRNMAAPLASLLELQLELLMSALALHPGEANYVHLVLRGAVELLEQKGEADLDVKSIESIINLLAAPLTQAQLMPAVLAMPHHSNLMGELDTASQREAAVAMLSALLEANVAISDSDTLQRLFVLIDHLIHDETGGENKFWEFDLGRFTVEQEKVARLVHQVRDPEASKVFEMLVVVRRYLNEGGKHRICHTLPAVVISTLRLVMPLIEQQHNATTTSPPTVSVDELFEFAHETCTALGLLQPEECLPLWLIVASTAMRADQAFGGLGSLGSTCSRFIERALSCLETDILDQKAQFRGLSLVVGTLCQITCLQADVYELLAERTLRFGARLKTKRLQSKAHCICSNLFWSPRFHSAHRVLLCLRSALHLADDAIHNDPLDIGLFVEIFDQAVLLFEAGNEEITDTFLSGLFSVCKHHLKYVEGRAPLEAQRALRAAAKFIQSKAADSRYSKLQADASDASLQTLDAG